MPSTGRIELWLAGRLAASTTYGRALPGNPTTSVVLTVNTAARDDRPEFVGVERGALKGDHAAAAHHASDRGYETGSVHHRAGRQGPASRTGGANEVEMGIKGFRRRP